MTKRLLVLFSFVICFSSWGVTHDECEALKTDINQRLDTIDSSCSTFVSDISFIKNVIDNTYTAKYSTTDPSDPGSLQSTSSTYYLDSSGSPLGTLGEVSTHCDSMLFQVQVTTNQTAYIRALLRTVDCSEPTNGACNCAAQLAQISVQVDRIFGELSQQFATIEEFLNFFDIFYTDFKSYSGGVLDGFSALTNDFHTFTNQLFNWRPDYVDSSGFNTYYKIPVYWKTQKGINNVSSLYFRPFNTLSTFSSSTLSEVLRYGMLYNIGALNSLNNYSYTNLFLSSSIHELVSSVNTNLFSVNSKLSSITNSFSIFNDFVFSSDAPLSMYTDVYTDGSYRDYLTNYYIKVSKGQQSGSDNFTNWFSRIEILLASLVFRDEGTNFVDEAENTSQFENTLSQSVDTLSQAVSMPRNVTDKIDNMGQSFLGLLSEWRTIVSGNSLPSQFVFCDINLGSQSRDSSGGSSVSSFRLETSLDSGEFRQFLDFCHAITTILFTMLFVWLSIMLLSFLLASLAKLVQFCYMVYSALFGG